MEPQKKPQTTKEVRAMFKNLNRSGSVGRARGSFAEAAIGCNGVTIRVLRPTGWARFGSKKLRVVSHAASIPRDAAVEIVEVQGDRCVVETPYPS